MQLQEILLRESGELENDTLRINGANLQVKALYN